MKHHYFISDAHLGARYIADAVAHERMLCHVLEQMAEDAEAIYMMGDMLDFWFEWHNVVPRGYVRFFGTVARIVDKGVKVYWFKGNHDMWLFDYLRNELGVTVVDDMMTCKIDGSNFVLSHGDNLGPIPTGYKFLRALFRNRTAQFALSILHPRITLPFAHAWSAHSRGNDEPVPYAGDDAEPVMIFAREWQKTHPDTDYYVCGHRHICTVRQVPDSKAQLVMLGDFYRQFTYAVFDGETMQIVHYDNQNAQFNLN